MPAHDTNQAAAEHLRAQLNSRFRGPLMAYFGKRIRDRSEAQDLTQETLVRILASLAVTHIEHAEAYVFTTASNLLKEYRRRSVKFHPSAWVPIEEAVASELESELVEGLTPERLLHTRDCLQEALDVLGELGERTRDIFVLFKLENMKQKDVAAAFGISTSTVEKHVMRAVLHLASRQGGRRE